MHTYIKRFNLTSSSQPNMDRQHNSNPHWKGAASAISDGTHGVLEFIIPAKALNIIWGNDPRFWQWIKLSEDETRMLSGFQEAAMLVQVNWLEVTGKLSVNNMVKNKNIGRARYEIYYVIKFRIDAFGWRSVPVKLKVRGLNGEVRVRKVVLEAYREKPNQWHEIYGGEFEVTDKTGFVEFGMFEDESEWWKGSMILAGIKIKPKTD